MSNKNRSKSLLIISILEPTPGREGMKRKSFLKNDSARVPFAVIGVFLILISTIISINLTRLDINMAKTMSSSLEVTSADKAIQYARADIARAVNYAGLEALKQIGETPVIKVVCG